MRGLGGQVCLGAGRPPSPPPRPGGQQVVGRGSWKQMARGAGAACAVKHARWADGIALLGLAERRPGGASRSSRGPETCPLHQSQ